jgi:hypothetical protein
MRSDREDPMSEQEIYALLEEALIEPVAPASPEVQERYQQMIRAHFRGASAQRPGWRSFAVLTACVSVMLGLAVAPGFSVVFVLTTVVCAGTYVALLRYAARRLVPAGPG